MKAEFELTVDDKTGVPLIKIRHHDKSNALEQKLLKLFLESAQENGIRIRKVSGYLEMGTNNSWEVYHIETKGE